MHEHVCARSRPATTCHRADTSYRLIPQSCAVISLEVGQHKRRVSPRIASSRQDGRVEPTPNSETNHAHTDEGNWFFFHPQELVATFLLPCPDPLPIPDGTVFPTYHQLEKTSISLIEDRLNELALQSATMDAVAPAADMAGRPPDEGGAESQRSPGVVNWSNKHVLVTSIQMHQTFSDAALRVGLEPALRVAEVTSKGRLTAEERARAMRRSEEASAWQSDAETHLRDLGLGAVTVAECYIGLRILGALPALPGPLVHDYLDDRPFGPLESERVYPELNYMWQWRAFPTGQAPPAELLERRLRLALDIALSELRSIQRAAQVLRRTGTSLSTIERLPLFVPVIVRTAAEVGDDRAEQLSVLLATKPDPVGLVAPEPLDEQSRAVFNRTRARLDSGPFMSHVDLHRDAQFALERMGDRRLGALLLGVASEALLDELLLHLMWEEIRTPEEVARSWYGGLDKRIRTELPTRLGGSWDITQQNPIGAWALRVASLRHRIAHAGYTPTSDEAQASFEATNALVTHLGDRLVSPENLRRYPRTALALLGESGLRRRNAYNARIRRLEGDRKEVPWAETFGRWREAWRRIRQDLTVGPREPDFDQAGLMAIRHPPDQVRWIKHARPLHLAIEVDVDAATLPTGLLARINELADGTSFGRTNPISIAFEMRITAVRRVDAEWVEEYHHVPTTGVMIDRSDYKHPPGAP